MQPQKPDTEFRAVIFDMDGVIVDSESRHAHALFEVVREIGYGETHGVDWADYVGRSDHELWMDFVARHKPAHSLERLLEMKRDRVLEVIRRDQPVYAGLTELVEKLARVCRLGLASGSDRPVVEAVLSLRDLRRHFSATVTASEVKRGKPAPEIFLRTLARLGREPAEAIFIDDFAHNVAGARAVGMAAIHYTPDLNVAAALAEHGIAVMARG